MVPILNLPYDPSKRYLVFGDIHGRLEKADACLLKAKYNANNDIVLTVGDMIDRGTDNIKTVGYFLNTPDWYSCMGNHEEMVLRPELHGIWKYNGGDVTLRELDVYGEQLIDFQNRLEDLPYVITVGDGIEEGSFRLVHAELPLVSDSILNYSISVAKNRNSTILQHCIWGRTVIEEWYRKNSVKEGVTNIASLKYKNSLKVLETTQILPTYCGHTPVKIPVTIGSRTYIDTGMQTLTLMDAHTKTYWQA